MRAKRTLAKMRTQIPSPKKMLNTKQTLASQHRPRAKHSVYRQSTAKTQTYFGGTGCALIKCQADRQNIIKS